MKENIMVTADPKAEVNYTAMTDRQLFEAAILKWKNAVGKINRKTSSLDFVNPQGVRVNVFLAVRQDYASAFEIRFKAGNKTVKTFQLISIIDAVNIAENPTLAKDFDFAPNCDEKNINEVTIAKVAA